MVPTYAGLRHSSSRRMFPLEPDPIAVRVVCDHAAPFDNLKHFLLHPRLSGTEIGESGQHLVQTHA